MPAYLILLSIIVYFGGFVLTQLALADAKWLADWDHEYREARAVAYIFAGWVWPAVFVGGVGLILWEGAHYFARGVRDLYRIARGARRGRPEFPTARARRTK